MIGERIRLVREASLLTQHELAGSAGISQSTLWAIENSEITPSNDVLSRIASVTAYPVMFFHLGVLPDMPDGYHRKLQKGTAKAEKQVRAHVRILVDLVQRGERVVKLPPVILERVSQIPGIEEVEEVASEARHIIGIGERDPIPNLTRAVERAGVVVVRLPFEQGDYNAYSVWPDKAHGGRPVIALTGGHPGDRDRANVAHELGHLVLHPDRPMIDPETAEQEAWRFAGALLFPKAAAMEALRPPVTLKTLSGVKAAYGISIAFGIQRARELDLISNAQFVSFRKQLASRRWLHNEPIDVPRESPLLIAKIVEMMGGRGTVKQRADRVSMPIFSFHALAAG
jgi:Zn-dependent peptidase ImmA (M78 family)/DNA-binding XRE family transcriptional regulator